MEAVGTVLPAILEVRDSILMKDRTPWCRMVPVGKGTRLSDLTRLGANLPRERLAAAIDGTPVADHDDPVVPRGAHVIVAPRPGDLTTGILIAVSVLSTVASAVLMRRPKLSGSDTPREQRFGFGRISENAGPGDVIPVVLGTRVRHGGRVIGKVPMDAPDGQGNDRLLVVLALSHGPVARIGNLTGDADNVDASAVTGIYLQDQPIANFPGTKVHVRMGGASQRPMLGFENVTRLREVGSGGVTLRNTSGSDRTSGSPSAEAFTFVTSSPVNALTVRVSLDGGLYSVNTDGQAVSRRVQYRLRSRPVAGAWGAWRVITLEQLRQSQFYSSPRIEIGATATATEVQVERVSAESGATADVDALRWDSVVEEEDGQQTYAGIALLGVELTAGDQLQNEPRVSVDMDGYAACRVWDQVSGPEAPVFTSGFTRNPAELALEILTNPVWGLGAEVSLADVDMVTWLEAIAAGNAMETVTRADGTTFSEHRWRCDLVLDRKQPGDEWLRTILATMEAAPARAGDQWRVVVDAPRTLATEVFTDGSIAADDNGNPRLRFTYRASVPRPGAPAVAANQVQVQFENADEANRVDTVSYPRDGTMWLGEPDNETPLVEQVRLDGVTRATQALRHAVRRMRQIRFVTQTVSFTTTHDVVAVLPGERFDLAAGLAAYGVAAGRIAAGSTQTAVRLAQPVLLPANASLRVVQLDGSVEVRAIVTAPGLQEAREPINVSPAFTSAPLADAEFVIERSEAGVTVAAAKPYICTRVRMADTEQMVFEIEGQEYVDIYGPPDQPVVLPRYSDLVNPDTPPGPLLGLSAFEQTPQGARVPQVVLAWTQDPRDRANTASFRVWYRFVGTTTWIAAATSTTNVSSRTAVLEIQEIDRGYEFVVTAVSRNGVALAPADPRHPVARLLLGLGLESVPPPTGLTATQVAGNTWDLTWDAVEGAAGYIVYSGADPASGSSGGLHSNCADAFIVSRVTETALRGLRLPVSVGSVHFYVRSVARNGRMSQGVATASVTNTTPATGLAVIHTLNANFATGTLTNATLDAGAYRATTSSSPWSWESGEIDTGSTGNRELVVRLRTAHRTEDAAIEDLPWSVPSLEHDSWTLRLPLAAGGGTGLMWPPYPDNMHQWLVEIAPKVGGNYGPWQRVTPFAQLALPGLRYYKVRVTATRGAYPYRPGVVGLDVVTMG